MTINIRKATAADLHEIYNLVKSLAIYEKAEAEVTATIEDYQNDFAAGIFQAHVAETDGKVIGMVLYYMNYSTWKGRMLYRRFCSLRGISTLRCWAIIME